jgi:hypothetical protein
MIGIDGDRSEKCRAGPSADGDLGHAERCDEVVAEMRDKAIPREMPLALAHAIRRTREPAGPENASVKPRYFGDILRNGFADGERWRHGFRISGRRMGGF